jgi:ATP-dependent DNA ligase
MVLIGPLEPARARLAKTFPVGPEWVYEPKWDGFRCLLFRRDTEVRYDQFSDGRFRHTCTLIRFRPEKAPEDCVLEQQSGLVSFNALIAS